MLPPLPDAKHDQHAQAALLLTRAMQQDVEGQRALIAARTQGETAAVYWDARDAAAHWREQGRRRVEETRHAILRISIATASVRRQIARSRALLRPASVRQANVDHRACFHR